MPYNVTSIRSFSVVERKKNLGGGFWIKAVTGYSLLDDVENIFILRNDSGAELCPILFLVFLL